MIKLISLTAKNFLSYKHLNLSLIDRGLVLISGKNTSGKSSIPSAISWCLFGKTIKGLTGDNIVNWDENQDCMVEVNLTKPTIPISSQGYHNIIIRRWRLDSDRGNKVEVEVDGNLVSGRQTDVQATINELLRTDFKTFINSTLFSQGLVKYLAEETDKGQREVFKKFLSLGDFDQAAERAAGQYTALDESITTAKQNWSNIKDKHIFLSETFERNQAYFEAYEEKRQGKISLLRANLGSLEKPQVPTLGEFDENVYVRLNETLALKIQDKTASQISKAQCDERIRQRRDSYKSFSTLEGRCPVCRQNIDSDTMGRHLQELSDQLRDEQQRGKDIDSRIATLDGEIQQLQQKQVKLQEMERINTQLTSDYEQKYQNYKRECQLTQAQIDELTPENPYEQTIQDLQIQLDKLPNIQSLEKEITGMEDSLVYLDYIKEMFKPRGIQAYVIEHSFEFLNTKVNEYLRELTNGEISMEFVPQKELKKGGFREEITLRFEKHGRDIVYENLSDAERAGTHIAIIFALHSFAISQGVSNFDFLFLDEILDLSLDEMRSENLNGLLQNLNREIASIFVISHKSEIKSAFPMTWEVTIEDGESSIGGD